MQEPMMPVSQVEKLVRVLMALERRALIANYHEHRPDQAGQMYKMVGRIMAENGLSTLREL